MNLHMTSAPTNVAKQSSAAPLCELDISVNKLPASWLWSNWNVSCMFDMYGTVGVKPVKGELALSSTPGFNKDHGPSGPTTTGSTNVTYTLCTAAAFLVPYPAFPSFDVDDGSVHSWKSSAFWHANCWSSSATSPWWHINVEDCTIIRSRGA